jgi:hypothetical protein
MNEIVCFPFFLIEKLLRFPEEACASFEMDTPILIRQLITRA